MHLENRVVVSPMAQYKAVDGCPTDWHFAHYAERAKGGAGLVYTEMTCVSPEGRITPGCTGLYAPEHEAAWRRLTGFVHAETQAKLCCQIGHSGRKGSTQLGWETIDAPLADGNWPTMSASAIAWAPANPVPKAMDRADMDMVTAQFVAATEMAQRAGFDMVELHAAHTYILAGFLSPYYNKRDDAYGGPIENRARLLVETIRAVKKRTGADFPVWVRLDGEELRTEGGITVVDAIAAAKLAEQAGADAISMSAYATITTGVAFTEAPLVQQPGALVGYAAAVKKEVRVPVIAAGRISPEMANEGIERGLFDFVAMGRKLLADPDLPNKLAENRRQDVRPCIYCYVCVSQIFINQRVKCAVNAQVGHEFEAPIEAAATPRHIVVVGGGPAGMEAARVAALRGHRVTLVERSDRLGGTLFFAGLAYNPNGRLLDYLTAQVRGLPITLRLSTEASVALMAELKPDAIVVATGARRDAPPIPGAELNHVWSGDELRRLMTNDGADEIARRKLNLAQRAMFKAGGVLRVTDSAQAIQNLSKLWMPLGRRVVIVGGGLVGLELAEFLIARGREVTVLEPSDKPGRELAVVRRWRVLDAVETHAKLHRQAQVSEITAQDVRWTDAQGAPQRTPADSVVLALGASTDDSVATALQACGVPVHRIGDCADLGYIERAMHDGHRVGRQV